MEPPASSAVAVIMRFVGPLKLAPFAGLVIDTVGGVFPPVTVTEPSISGCGEQKYAKVPGLLKVCVKVCPCPRKPEFHKPFGTGLCPLVEVWEIKASFWVHLTESLTCALTFGG